MFFDAVENTFKILEEKGITREFLYGNAEQKDGFNIPLEEVCQKLGIKVDYVANLKDKEYDFLISGTSDAKKKIIKINSSENEKRQLFTLGHELYHVLNNQSMNRSEDMICNEDKKANSFSAELLMPHDYLLKRYIQKNGDINEIAKYFKVSTQALGFKLLNDGIVVSI